jgi:hypothetical protein
MLDWFDRKITQWRLFYFRAFKMKGIPQPPKRRVEHMAREQEARKGQEKRQAELGQLGKQDRGGE